MMLAEKFNGFTQWPVSRKTVLFSGLSVLATFLISMVWNEHWLDTLKFSLLYPYMLLWAGMFLIATLVSVPAAIAGRDARWTAYLMVFMDAPLIVGFVQMFGSMSSPFVAFFPTLVILWAIYFDERISWWGFGWIVFWFVVTGILEETGVLPYAPILLDRSVDSQSSHAWFGAMLFASMDLFFFCFLLCLSVLGIRRMQDQQLEQAHDALKRVNQLISRYVPTQLSERLCILPASHDMVQPERRPLVIFFSDIQGFTYASDELDAEELAGILNEYLSEMMAIADSFGATVSQVIGDGIMVFFGAPQATNDRDHALKAVRMSLKMQQRMGELQRIWFLRGYQRPFGIRIGINFGVATVGDFGSEGRKLYSAIGVQANLAQRIQMHCDAGRVLVSQSVMELISNEIPSTFKCHVPVKHLAEPVAVYEIIEVSQQAAPAQRPHAG